MTLDKLLTLSSSDWDTLSDAELHKILLPYFQVTRPDLQKVLAKQSEKKVRRASKSSVNDLVAMARQLGINIPS